MAMLDEQRAKSGVDLMRVEQRVSQASVARVS